MPTKISEAIGLEPTALDAAGVFDGFIDIDARLYVDPHLLTSTSAPELVNAYGAFRRHFEEIILVLAACTSQADRFFREASHRLTFRELGPIGLGYARAGNHGSGIGPTLARNIAATALEIIGAGIRDPAIFELVGLLEKDIGPDRISDMTSSIILPDLAHFTQRIIRDFGLPSDPYQIRGQQFQLPRVKGKPLILLPQDILRDLPIAYSWSDIDYVCAHNAKLRERINALIGNTWKDATKRITKRELREALLSNPEALSDLIAQYQDKPADAYDFQRDRTGEVSWHASAQKFAQENPLIIQPARPLTGAMLLPIVRQISNKFRDLVHLNGLDMVFYDDAGKLRHERIAQLVFYGVADSYCEANDLDLSREPNAGRGPVDFKISRGHSAKVQVEVKYSSNTSLVKGYTKQLPIYNAAERTTDSIYLIIRTAEATNAIDEVLELERKAMERGERTPETIVIDGRIKPSASKA